MARLKSKTIIFPLAGQHRVMGYQRQPPFTTVRCGDVLPRDATAERARGGSRPGLTKVFSEQLGGGEPIRSLATVRQLNQTTDFRNDEFRSALTTWWLAVPGYSNMPLTYEDLLVPELDGYAMCGPFNSEINDRVMERAVMANPVDIKNGELYSIQITQPALFYIASPDICVGAPTTIAILARMDGANPVTTDGVYAYYTDPFEHLPIVGLKIYESSSLVVDWSRTLSEELQHDAVTLRLSIQESGMAASRQVKLSLNGTLEVTADGYGTGDNEGPIAASVGEYAGFVVSLAQTYPKNRITAIDSFEWNYTIHESNAAITRVVAISDTDIYHEDNARALTRIQRPPTVTDGNVQLPAAELFGKLYIANGAQQVLLVEPFANTEAEQVSGSPESNAIATYRSRLATAGADEVGGDPSGDDPYNWYMCALGDATNWNTAGGLLTSAISGNTSGVDTGRMPSVITAFAAPSDDYLFVASLDAVAVIRGDPRRGGSMDLLSSKVGFLGPMAYCITPGGRTFFLSRMGLYVLEGPIPPVPVSERVLPLALKKINSVANAVCLGYDPDRNGILICVSPWAGGTGINYFYTLEPAGFWPISFHADHQPFSMVTVSADHIAAAGLIVGCRDGYIRRFSNVSSTDDGETITSYVLIGPLKLGANEGDSGLLAHLNAIMGGISGDVTWSLHMGDSAEEALAASAQESGTWGAGVADRDSPFARGATCFLKLSGTDRWTMESVRLAFEPYAVSTRL